MRKAAALLLLTALLTSSCARDAVLEIELTLPPAPTSGAAYARVLFARGDEPFPPLWADADHFPPQMLDGHAVTYSLVTEHPANVRMKILFCSATTPDCVETASTPALWYELEQPFYIGQRTRWSTTITLPGGTLPPPPTEASVVHVGKCAIAGCIDATSTGADYCRADGTHFCE